MSIRAWWQELGETRAAVRPELQHVRRSGRSLVAQANALFRASEQAQPQSQRIVDDPWAAKVVDPHPLVRAISASRHALPPVARELERLRIAHCTRHRALDELVRGALGDGYRQIVIVGAGLDMRASRLASPGRLPTAWFEVDDLHALRAKQARLSGLGAAPVHAVGLDLRHGALGPALIQAGLQPDQPVCWVLEGLLHYLPEEATAALTADIGSGTAPRRVLLSCITPAMAARASAAFASLVKLVREVPRRYDDRASLAARFAPYQLNLSGYWEFADQVQAFAPQAAGRPIGVSQDVARLDRGMP